MNEIQHKNFNFNSDDQKFKIKKFTHIYIHTRKYILSNTQNFFIDENEAKDKYLKMIINTRYLSVLNKTTEIIFVTTLKA